MDLTSTEAEKLAFDFLMRDWDISTDDQEWFTILTSRLIDSDWYIVEVGVEGLPDKWLLQVYDTGECDPSYTFVSPIKASESKTDLADMPERIAEILVAERHAFVK